MKYEDLIETPKILANLIEGIYDAIWIMEVKWNEVNWGLQWNCNSSERHFCRKGYIFEIYTNTEAKWSIFTQNESEDIQTPTVKAGNRDKVTTTKSTWVSTEFSQNSQSDTQLTETLWKQN
jgi:hypothetical protein